MKRIKLLISAVVFTIAFLCGGSRAVFADEVNKLMMTVSPTVQKIVLVPGETYHGLVEVSAANENTMDAIFSTGVDPFNLKKKADGKDYENDFVMETDYNQIVDWISVEEKEGVVSPNGTVKVHYSINVPQNAPAGGQYAAIVVRNENQDLTTDSAGGTTVVSVYQIASIILAQVTGKTMETGNIKENSIPAFTFDGSSFKAESIVENTGNVHTDAEYTLQVWPLFSGEEICTNEEKPDTDLVMPGVEKYHTQSCNLPAFGIFNVKQTVKIFDQTSTVERMVIVCPMWLLFIIIFLIALGIIYLVAKSKKRKEN